MSRYRSIQRSIEIDTISIIRRIIRHRRRRRRIIERYSVINENEDRISHTQAPNTTRSGHLTYDHSSYRWVVSYFFFISLRIALHCISYARPSSFFLHSLAKIKRDSLQQQQVFIISYSLPKLTRIHFNTKWIRS